MGSHQDEHARQPLESGVKGGGKRIFQLTILADIAQRIRHPALIGNDWIEMSPLLQGRALLRQIGHWADRHDCCRQGVVRVAQGYGRGKGKAAAR